MTSNVEQGIFDNIFIVAISRKFSQKSVIAEFLRINLLLLPEAHYYFSGFVRLALLGTYVSHAGGSNPNLSASWFSTESGDGLSGLLVRCEIRCVNLSVVWFNIQAMPFEQAILSKFRRYCPGLKFLSVTWHPRKI